MKPAPFNYYAPNTISAALEILGSIEGSRPLAGGQSLVPMMAFRLTRPAALVDLNTVPELAGIRQENGMLIIKSMTRQAEVLESGEVQTRAPLLVEALSNVGHPPTRARGTIGGSLANADPAAELPVVMVALAARMLIAGPKGAREIAAAEFFTGMFETALADDELLTEVRLPFQRGASAFLEFSRRKGDFAIVSVAVNLVLEDDKRCAEAAIVFGGVASTPVRCAEAERELVGKQFHHVLIEAAASAVPVVMVELDSHGASFQYRHQLARVLLRRALALAMSRWRAR